MNLEEAFPLTAEEMKRVAAFPDATPDIWKEFATSIHRHLLEAYADQDIDFRQLLDLTRRVSLGCRTEDRISLLGATAERGLTNKPHLPHRNGSRPRYPMALKLAAVDLVKRARELSPGTNLEPCIELAVSWLRKLRLFPIPPTVRTVHRWYIERQKGLGRAAPRGRPRKKKMH